MQIIFERNTLKTRKGSTIKRSKWGVGKDIGGSLYVHMNYIPDEFKQKVADARLAISIEHPRFDPNVVRIDYKKDSIAFYDSVEFDVSHEPAAGNMVVYKDDVVSKIRFVKQIWHHKWLWVKDDYKGFDVDAAYNRSAQWLDHDDIPFARIGNKQTWGEWLKSVNLSETSLIESLDKPVRVIYPNSERPKAEKKPIEGLFQVGSNMYRVLLIPRGIEWEDENVPNSDAKFVKAVEVHFQVRVGATYSSDLTTSDNPLQVFATVINEALRFVTRYTCETVVTSIKDGNTKRVKLYKRIFNKYGNEHGFKSSFETKEDVSIFMLEK